MKNIIKPILFRKSDIEKDLYSFDIKISDIIKTQIIITTYQNFFGETNWKVSFLSCNNYKGFDISKLPGDRAYTKFGFNTYEEAENWANEFYVTKMNKIVSETLSDFKKYINYNFLGDDINV